MANVIYPVSGTGRPLAGGIIQQYANDLIIKTINSGDIKINPAGDFTTEKKNANNRIRISSGDGVSYYLSGILIEENGVARWSIAKSNDAAGFLYITRYNDAGAAVDSPIVIHRNTGAIQSYGQLVVRKNAIPKADNTDNLGSSTLRFAALYAVNVIAGDYIFQNMWRLTELDNGIALVRPDGSIAYFWK